MNKKQKAKTGFTFMELSVTAVLFTLFVIAAIKGMALYNKAVDFANSRNPETTNSSDEPQLNVVQSIADLKLWYNTTDSNSFVPEQAVDGSYITTWNDIKNISTDSANNARQLVSIYRPQYVANSISSNIAGVRFDGVDDYLSFDGSFFANSDYTLFVVEKRLTNDIQQFFIGGTNTATAAQLIVGHSGQGFRWFHYRDIINTTHPNLSSNNPYIHSLRFSTSLGSAYWLNGGSNPDIYNSVSKTPLSSYNGATLGKSIGNITYPYNGILFEIVAYNRALNDEERQLVETYLSEKYNIAIN